VSKVESIHDVTSERVLSSKALSLSVSCLFVPTDCWSLPFENIGFRIMYVNITFCVLLHKYPSKTSRMLEEAHGKAAMEKMQVYKCHERFHYGRFAVNCLLRQMTETSSMCTILCVCTAKGTTLKEML
jgi:hypothetical protein